MCRPKRRCCIDARFYEEINDTSDEDLDEILDEATREEEGDVVRSSEESGDEETVESLPEDDALNEDDLQEIGEEMEGDESDEEPAMVEFAGNHISPSGIIWNERHEKVYAPGRQPHRNIIRFVSGPTHGANPRTEEESFLMFMEDALITTLQYTNLQGRRTVSSWNISNPNKKKTFKPIDMDELRGFVGLVIIMGEFSTSLKRLILVII